MSVNMIIKIFANNFIGYITACRAKISSSPKMSAPVFLTNLRKLLLYSSRRTAFGNLYKLTYRNMWRNRDEQMDVVLRQNSINNFNPHFFSNLSNNFSNSQTQVSIQNTIPIFSYPHNMVTMMVNRMLAVSVAGHSRIIARVLKNFPSGRWRFQPLERGL